jgi:hypothetical protein
VSFDEKTFWGSTKNVSIECGLDYYSFAGSLYGPNETQEIRVALGRIAASMEQVARKSL